MIRDKVAIVGVGQMGQHHLQAILQIKRPLDIFLVDSNQRALKQANETAHNVVSYNHISSLPPELDVVIVATTADVRKSIVEDLLSSKKLKYLILEKVVFQHPDDFIQIHKLLIEKQVKAWVNCPLRMVPFFQQLKQNHIPKQLDYRISGSLWNLGSNAIHHLDLLAYLTGDYHIILDSSLLDLRTTSNKRPGFIEFTGTLQGRTKNGSTISLTSYREKAVPQCIQISSMYGRLILMQNERKAWISEESLGWKWSEREFIIPYQSQLTNIVVEQLLDTGTCHLTSYEQSWKLHIPLLNVLLDHLQKKKSRRFHICPIT